MSTPRWIRGAALALACALAVPAAVQAEAPMARTAAPGFFRMMLGSFEVTALYDGAIELQVDQLLTHTTPSQVERLLARARQTTTVPTSVNGFLIHTGSKLVLVDTGAAGLFGPTLGKLVANLKAAGYQPEQVDEVLITHLHPDHVGGLMAGDTMVFPNATVRADWHDSEYWLSEANMAKAPKDAQGFFQGAMASLNPYVKAGRFQAFKEDTQIAPGIRAIAAHGHTPGHSVFEIESQGRKLVLWGDLMHVAAVQFPAPQVTIKFDTDSNAARAQRLKLFAQAAKSGTLVGAAHLPFPGLGTLRPEGKGYAFVPVDYNLMQLMR